MKTLVNIDNEVILSGRRNNQCWFQPFITVAPGWGENAGPEVFLCTHLIVGSDMGDPYWIRTCDGGKTWTPPMMSQNLLGQPLVDDIFEKFWLAPRYHQASNTLLAIGGATITRDAGDPDHVGHKMEEHVPAPKGYRRRLIYSSWDRDRCDFVPWKEWDVVNPERPTDLEIYIL